MPQLSTFEYREVRLEHAGKSLNIALVFSFSLTPLSDDFHNHSLVIMEKSRTLIGNLGLMTVSVLPNIIFSWAILNFLTSFHVEFNIYKFSQGSNTSVPVNKDRVMSFITISIYFYHIILVNSRSQICPNLREEEVESTSG